MSLSLFWAWYSSSKLNKKPQKHHFKECLADTHKDAFTLIQQKIPLSLDTDSSWSSFASFGAWYSTSKLNQKPQKHHFKECSADTNQDAFTLIKKKTIPLSLDTWTSSRSSIALFWAWYSLSKFNKKPQKNLFKECLADTHQDAFTLIQQKIPFSLDTSNSSWSSRASFWAWYSSSKLKQKPQKHHFKECSADTNQDAFTLIKKKTIPLSLDTWTSSRSSIALFWAWYSLSKFNKKPQKNLFKECLADTHQDAFTLIQQKIPFSLDTSNSSWSSRASFWAWYSSSKLKQKPQKHHFKECSADTHQDAFTLIKKKQYLCPLTPELSPDHQLLCFEPDTPCLKFNNNPEKDLFKEWSTNTHQDVFIIQQNHTFDPWHLSFVLIISCFVFTLILLD